MSIGSKDISKLACGVFGLSGAMRRHGRPLPFLRGLGVALLSGGAENHG